MAEIFKILILAIVQGITEFLPISSSGHLAIMQGLFGLKEPGAGLEIALHFGTLLAIIVFYRKFLFDLVADAFDKIKEKRKKSFSFIGIIVIATIPAGIVGILFEDKIATAFDSPRFSAVMLVVTGLILFSTLFERKGTREINLPIGIIIGVAQAIAILPGISRSGATISTARALQIEPDESARFSFVLSIPAIFGATLLELKKEGTGFLSIQHLIGAVIAFIIGYFSLKILVVLLKRGRFWVFAPYCISVGALVLIFL